jgi:hypothetical protein
MLNHNAKIPKHECIQAILVAYSKVFSGLRYFRIRLTCVNASIMIMSENAENSNMFAMLDKVVALLHAKLIHSKVKSTCLIIVLISIFYIIMYGKQ